MFYLFLQSFSGIKYFRKILEWFFGIIEKCLDLNYLELFLCIFFKSKYFAMRLKKIFDGIDSEPRV